MFSELVARNSRRSRRENGLFFTSLLISIVAFYIILSLSHQDVMVFLQRMESSAVDRLLTLVPVLYGLTLFILFFLVYYANRFQLARRRHEFGVYLMLGMLNTLCSFDSLIKWKQYITKSLNNQGICFWCLGMFTKPAGLMGFKEVIGRIL